MEGARTAPGTARKGAQSAPRKSRADAGPPVPSDPRALGRYLEALEQEMLNHARNLEFEEAAAVRDRIRTLRAERLLA